MRTRASILVGLLWCLALLSLVVVGVLHSVRMDLAVTKNYGDRIQAHYLALAGVEKARALLFQDARLRSRSAQNHSGELYDAPQHFGTTPLGRGEFRVFRPGRSDEGRGVVYGVSDEESRLNVNTASAEELGRIQGMTPDVVAAIVDWRDADNTVSPGGAEVDYYASLQPPYQPRNGPFPTIRELLMVRGITRELLFGNRVSQADGAGESSAAGLAQSTDSGWAALLTVDSSDENVNAAGQDRVNVQSADEATLTSVKGISAEIARAIIAYRGQNRLQSIADLLDVTAAQNQNPLRSPGNAAPPGGNPRPPGSGQSPAPGNPPAANPSGPRVVSEDLFLDIADDVTTESGRDLTGLVNLNTASLDVLACLPGLDRDLAQAIIAYRQSAGFFPNVAWLLRVPGMTRQIFSQLAPRVTARSETFRIRSEGIVPSSGTRPRIETVVHVGLQDTRTLAYREDDL